MRAVVQIVEGDPSTLEVGEVALPLPGPREVLIRVQCAAVNRMDLLQAKGGYPIPDDASEIIGVEVSGTVADVGEECEDGYAIGDAVMGLASGGGYAEFCVCDERTVFRAIPGLNMPALAAIPEAFMTAYQLCFLIGQAKAGESVLLHAAASSVGQAAIQMLHRKGVTVFATVRSAEKAVLCKSLGATAAFVLPSNGTSPIRFSDDVKCANDGRGVDLVLDPVGGAYMSENLDVLGLDGRMLLYGLMGGVGVTDPHFLKKLMSKRLQISSSTLRSRTIEYKHRLAQCLKSDPDALAAIQSGDIKVRVDATFGMHEVLDAHEMMGRNENSGKIVLFVSSTGTAIENLEREIYNLSVRNKLNLRK